jgi:hypothetical protein
MLTVKNEFRQNNQSGLLKTPLPRLDDPEGDYLPASLPFTVDAHLNFLTSGCQKKPV